MLFMHDTVTVWNKHYDEAARKTKYYRHVVNSCNWETVTVRGVSDTGVFIGSSYEVLVEAQAGYLPYAAWKSIPAGDKARYFTFNTGDLIAKNVHETDIDGVTVTEAKVKAELKPDVFTVASVSDLTQGYKLARHIEVSGA